MTRRLSAVRADRLDEFIAVLNPDAPQDILELQGWDVRRLTKAGLPAAPVLHRLARRMPDRSSILRAISSERSVGDQRRIPSGSAE